MKLKGVAAGFFIILLLSCKKDKIEGGSGKIKTPVFNAQEQLLLGNWSIDSTSLYNASSVYQSHALPNAQMEPRISFMGSFDCANCSDFGFYKAAQGTTPGNFDPAVWSAQVTDTLKFGPGRMFMNSYKILLLNSASLTIRLNTSSGYSLQYYHRTN